MSRKKRFLLKGLLVFEAEYTEGLCNYVGVPTAVAGFCPSLRGFYKERPQLSGPSRQAIDIHTYIHDRESGSSKYLPKHPISFFPAGRLPTLHGRGKQIMHTVECTFVPPCVCLLRKYVISLNRLTSPRKM